MEAKLALVEATNGAYIAAGPAMIHAKGNFHCLFEECAYDERMRKSFEVAGRVTGVTEDFLNMIGKHKSVIYITAPTGNLQAARQMALAGAALLKAGGIGIKVETAGKAFEKDEWLRLTEDEEDASLYEMFVVDSLMDADGTVFTCGMQNLGLKDAIVSGLPFEQAADLVRILGYYQLVDKPVIMAGQTFTPTVSSPMYRFSEELNAPYNGHELFGNPFGTWRLMPVDEEYAQFK